MSAVGCWNVQDVRTGSISAYYLTLFHLGGGGRLRPKEKQVNTNTIDNTAALLMVQFAEQSW
jgi:hypothetical protein